MKGTHIRMECKRRQKHDYGVWYNAYEFLLQRYLIYSVKKFIWYCLGLGKEQRGFSTR